MINKLESAQEEDLASKKLSPEEEEAEAAFQKLDNDEARRWSCIQPQSRGRRPPDPTIIEIREECRKIRSKLSKRELRKREGQTASYNQKEASPHVSTSDFDVCDDKDPCE